MPLRAHAGGDEPARAALKVARARPESRSHTRTCRRARLAALAGAAIATVFHGAVWAENTGGTPRAQAVATVMAELNGHLPLPLDRQGKLLEALPLYRSQAERTQSTADRLRYADALMRAGSEPQARAIYEALIRTGSSHREGRSSTAAVCASSILRNGFPAVAVEYLRPAFDQAPDDVALGLLYIRALCAAGDCEAGRRRLQTIRRGEAGWPIGQRLELARLSIAAGDTDGARALLDGEPDEAVAQLYRDSILADLSLRARDWATASVTLAGATRKAPAGLEAKRVARHWRNVQRELRWVRLRRGISLWNEGLRDQAIDEAAAAQATDEELVRTSALIVLAAGDLVGDRRDAAIATLDALGGHDLRFATATTRLASALATGADPRDHLILLQSTLQGLDRSADAVTALVIEILAGATNVGRPVDQPRVSTVDQVVLVLGAHERRRKVRPADEIDRHGFPPIDVASTTRRG